MPRSRCLAARRTARRPPGGAAGRAVRPGSARRWRSARPGAPRCCWPMRWPAMPATAWRLLVAFAVARAAARGAVGRSPSAPPSTPARRHGGGCAPTRCRACCMPGRRSCARSTSGELTATVVDRIEALDGLFARWLPAAALAVAGPLLVALAALAADPLAALVLVAVRAAGAGRDGGRRHRRGGRLAQPVPGAGAAAGALPRPRAWHRHHRAVRPGGGRGALAGRGGRRIAAPHHARAARRLPVLGRARSRGGAAPSSCWRCTTAWRC